MIAKIVANRESKGHKVGAIDREGIRTLYFVAVRRAEGNSDIFDTMLVKAAGLAFRIRNRKTA